MEGQFDTHEKLMPDWKNSKKKRKGSPNSNRQVYTPSSKYKASSTSGNKLRSKSSKKSTGRKRPKSANSVWKTKKGAKHKKLALRDISNQKEKRGAYAAPKEISAKSITASRIKRRRPRSAQRILTLLLLGHSLAPLSGGSS